MKYKILKGTKLFDKLTKLKEEMRRCNNVAMELAKELTGDTFISGHIDSCSLAGGMSGIRCTSRPKGWRNVFKKFTNDAYFPSDTVKNKELIGRINALPKVTYGQLNILLNFKNHESSINEATHQICFHPAVDFKENFYLVSVREWIENYKPVPDMEEITVTEYNKLLKAKK